MAHEVESMFFVGETPWHELGTKLEGRPTSADAIKAAGLDWEVDLKPLYTACEGEDCQVPTVDEKVSHRACYRKTDGRILGVVGPKWHPFQNAEAFSFFDPFIDSGEAAYETAGSLRGGERVWVLAALNLDPIQVVKGDDVRKYVLLSNGHDGQLGIHVGFTPIRVVCANTLQMAHDANASRLVRVHHTKSAAETMAKVRDVMNVVNQQFEATAEQYRALARTAISEEDLKKYVVRVFAPKRVKATLLETAKTIVEGMTAEDQVEQAIAEMKSNVLPKIQTFFESGRGNAMPGVKGTWWAAYNAVTEYIAHDRGADAESRLNSAWFGSGRAQNAKALALGVEMATAA